MPAHEIEPIQSDWDQIRTAPGMRVAGSSYGVYRVAVSESYVPWLASNGFRFQHVDPTKPVIEEESVQGRFTASRKADARYIQDAVHAITSGCPQGLVLAYRNHALVRQKLPIEWTILWCDLVMTSLRLMRNSTDLFLGVRYTHPHQISPESCVACSRLLR